MAGLYQSLRGCCSAYLGLLPEPGILNGLQIAFISDRGPWTAIDTLLAGLQATAPPDLAVNSYRSWSGLRGLDYRRWVRQAVLDGIDLLHVATTGPAAVAAHYVAQRLQVPVVCSCDSGLAAGTPVQRSYLRALCRASRSVFTASDAERRLLVSAGVPDRILRAWRPGVDSTRFAPDCRSEALRGRWGVSDSQPAVVFAGRLTEAHGARKLMSLQAALRRTVPMHRLIVAGDGPCRDEMQRRCEDAIFLGAVLPGEMPEVLASADVFVWLDEQGSSALAVLEAQACGMPCVVLEGPGTERLGPGSGIICRSIVDAIVETASLVRHAERRRALGKAARQHALAQEWSAGLAPIYQAYREFTSNTSRRRRHVTEPPYGVVHAIALEREVDR